MSAVLETAVPLPQPPEEWRRLRRYLKTKARIRVRRCAYCNRLMARYSETLDHIIPKCRGGTLTAVVCNECNSRKGDRTPLQLLAWSFRIICVLFAAWWEGSR